jgi:DNA invertase Pin-like site-specific DNA recombinase
MQLDALNRLAEARGWTVAEEYVDIGWSGSRENRPALDRLISDAYARRIDVVVVWKFDRFARSVRHLLKALDTFRALGVGFVSVTEQVDTATPLGAAVFVIVGAVAELERDLIRERVRAGLARARVRGKRLGRPRMAIDLAEAQRLRDSGLSLASTAAKLNVGKATLQRAFARRASDEPKTKQ